MASHKTGGRLGGCVRASVSSLSARAVLCTPYELCGVELCSSKEYKSQQIGSIAPAVYSCTRVRDLERSTLNGYRPYIG